MEITFIRHAQTTANVNHILAGWTDVELTDLGRNTTSDYVEQNFYPKVSRYFCSDLIRCRHTFELIYKETPVMYSDIFREINFGVYENKTYEEIDNVTFFYQWIHESREIEKGESFLMFCQRVKNGVLMILKTLEAHSESDAVLVCHSGYIRAVLNTFVDASIPFFQWDVPNALGYTLMFAYENNEFICQKVKPLSTVDMNKKTLSF